MLCSMVKGFFVYFLYLSVIHDFSLSTFFSLLFHFLILQSFFQNLKFKIRRNNDITPSQVTLILADSMRNMPGIVSLLGICLLQFPLVD